MLWQQFQNNMAAFQQFDPNVYDFFKDYEPKRFVVDIVDGFPNILDIEENEYLYNYPAYLIARGQVDSYKDEPKSAGAAFEMNDDNEAGFIHSDTLNQILKVLVNRVEKNGDQVRKLSKLVNSLMVFGVGCGYHIELLSIEHDIKNLYVIEPELDVFYASLFITNWAQVLEKVERCDLKIHFSLGAEQESFFEEVRRQSDLYGHYNIAKTYGFIHYHAEKISALTTEFKQRYAEFIQGWGFFDDAMMATSHMLTSIKQGVPMVKKRSLNENPLSDYPVLVIGNGPSLDGLVEFIKAHQDKAIIVSCGTALSALYQYGIIPDIHCEQERTYPIAKQIEYYCPPEVLDNLILWGPSTLHPDVYAKFPLKVMGLKGAEPTAPLIMESSVSELFEVQPFINPTVANTASSMALAFGFNNIYLLGVDLGHKKGGSHHSAKSMYYTQDGDDLEMYDSNAVSDLELEGNFGGVFHTDSFFGGSRRTLEYLIAGYPEQNFYNLSDGALIKGAVPTPSDTVTFNAGVIENKKEQLCSIMANCSHAGEEPLFEELANDLDYDGYEAFCLALIDAIDNLERNSEAYLELLKQHFLMLIDDKVCLRNHHYQTLKGTVLHVQAMLARILFEAVDEQDALDDFALAAMYYKQFLKDSISYYKENALKPHYYDTKWLAPLEESAKPK
ncbi:motility associated factor glycosyltransferase family protein [Thalassotalea euphylliae]|nr:6-hydroxymethylpterin diphosphokinase MptE-like protein [Thalassotalea euphylliae]